METINTLLVILSDAFIIATLTERIIQILKGFIPEEDVKKIRKEWWQIASVLTSLLIAALFHSSIGAYWPVVGMVASLGSNVLHDLIGIINNLKKDVKKAEENLQPIEIKGR